jgi:predicted MFS family arabinose efflux permease
MTWLALYIYRLPVTLFLKNHLHLGAETVSVFMFLTLMAWNFKPLAGLISDCFPFMGTRRRHYLMFAAFFGGLSWLLILILPKTYTLLLWLLIFMNVMTMMCSTVLGGLMVEVGQKFGVTGRLAAHRTAIMSLAGLVSGPVGGYLAGRAFGWTAGLCAGLLFCLIPFVWINLKEKPNPKRNLTVWRDTGTQLKILMRSRVLWWAVAMNVLLYIRPGFGTPLLYYQQGDLHFSEQFIGNLGFISGGCGILGAMVYSRMCRKIRLGPLMYAGVICAAISSFIYLGYRSASAAWIIEGCNGLFAGIAILVLYDLSARAAPAGCEALAYSLMMAAENLAQSLGDVVGSWMYEHWHWKFMDLVWLNGSTTLLILFVLPFLPSVLMDGRDGDHEVVIKD